MPPDGPASDSRAASGCESRTPPSRARTWSRLDREAALDDSRRMLDATQPWLPLLDDEPRADPPPVRKTRRRAGSAPTANCPGLEHRAARQAFLGVVASWALSATEALRLLGEPLSNEAERLDRLQGILGAHRSLLLIAPESGRTAQLLRRPDPALAGASLLEVMLQEGLPGISRARALLLAQIAR